MPVLLRWIPAFPLLLTLLLPLASAALASDRLFRPPEGFVSAKDLPEAFRARVAVLRFDRKDAFEGTVAHTSYDRKLFAAGTGWHAKTRESALRRRLPFAAGDTVDKQLLAESERALRAEEFLSDAVIFVKPLEGGACEVVLATFDQWTLIPVIGPAVQGLKPGDLFLGRWDRVRRSEWLWSLGLFESNVAGTGAKIGAVYRQDLERDTREAVFSDGNLTPLKLQITASAALLSDGDSLSLRINKPLLSHTDRFAYSLTLASKEVSERLYFDANRLDALPDSLAEARAGKLQIIRTYQRVATQRIEAAALRSFGDALKLDAGPVFQYREHYGRGGPGDADTALLPYAGLPASADRPEKSADAWAGASLSLYRSRFRSDRNFRNLKWNESVETGWRLSASASLNQAWLGADNADLRLSQAGSYAAYPRDGLYAGGGYGWQSFLSAGGDFNDGRADASGEAAWREHALTATWITASYSGLFATPGSVQLPLGELTGLAGYPSFYYAGQARFLAVAEQRLFPEFELLTAVPAFAAYAMAGNTFPTWRDFDAGDLHWSVGLGLRLGRSKSTLKTVQHINVNFPLGDEYLKGPVVSVVVRRSL